MKSDIEMTLAAHTCRRALVVAPALVAVVWGVRGPGAVWGALVGVAIVVANFLLAGWMLSAAIRRRPYLLPAAAMAGFVVRLGLVALALILITRFIAIDRVSVAMSVMASYVVLLCWEALAIGLGRERDLEWTL
jgi:hypothetical protein